MTRLAILAAVCAISAAGCSGSNSTPTSATVTPPPNTIVLTATLLPSQETPAASGPETAGSGTVSITMHLTRDGSGNITAATVDFLALMSGFPAGTVLTAAHIHRGLLGCTCPVVVGTTIANGEITMPNGSGSIVKPGIAVTPVDVAQAIVTDPSSFYFNIHTPANPLGAARGQLARTQ